MGEILSKQKTTFLNTMRQYRLDIIKNSKQLEAKANRLLSKLNKKPKKKKERKGRKYKNRIPVKYTVYIKSKWWTERKNKYYQKHKKICKACNSTKYINLHHMLYQDFGNEPDEILMPLCRNCHEEFHDEYATGYNMIEETYKFIERKREGI